MKKYILRWAMAVGLMLTLGCGSAMAADITVQLDGTALTFTDAQPVAKDGRTYVPFRSLFQAMGATVDYNGDTRTVTAVRGDKTAAFVLGQKEIQVTENGQTQTVVTDAPAYAENGRTLVPVRFAAQCFGMNVGWDPWYRTVVITDVDKLMDTVRGKFTKMDEYLAYVNGLHQKNYQVNGTLTNQMEVNDENGNAIPLETKSQITGLANHQNSQLQMESVTDLTPLLADLTEEQKKQNQTMLDLMAQQQTTILTDRQTETAYVQSLFYNTLGGQEKGSWYQTGWDSLFTNYSMNPQVMGLPQAEGESFEAILSRYLQNISVNSRNDTRVSKLFALFKSAFTDGNFQRTGGNWTAKGAVTTDDGCIYTIQTVLKMIDDEVRGYTFTITCKEGATSETMTADMTIGRNLTLTCERVTNNLRSSARGTFQLIETNQTPQAALPDGSTIEKIEKLSSLLGM